MSDPANAVAAQTGIPEDLVHKGIGAVLSLLKKELGEDVFEKLEAHIPGAATMLSSFESSAGTSQGGLLESVTSLAGKLLGSKAEEGATLLTSLTKLGFKPEQIESFVPKVLEFLKNHLPAELLERILAGLPGLAKLAGSEPE